MERYNKLKTPPKWALRTIQAGKLKGKTDINPQWRYEAMTSVFGLVGLGWKYTVDKLWTEQGAGETLAFAQVSVYVKDGDKWSDPIVGIGGSKLVQVEKGTPVSNDEGYKMAVTDAFSTALKMLGVAADIYAGRWDGSKYREDSPTEQRDKVIASGVAGDDFKVLMARASGLKEMCQNLDMPPESLAKLNAAYAGIKSIEDARVFIKNAEATASKYPEKSSFQDDKIPF